MTTAIKKHCPKCGSRIVTDYNWFNISELEEYCPCCGWRETVEAPPLERTEYHHPASPAKLKKIKAQLQSTRKIRESVG